jgi:DEAD/DEAH box helicase domain-containing protein
MDILENMKEKGWGIVHTRVLPGRKAGLFPVEDLELSNITGIYLKEKFPKGIFLHQKEAVRTFLEGKDVCMTTGTASGKSMAFYTSAIETLVKNPSARILAIYPLRALAFEQEDRWEEALGVARMPLKVGRIDGQVSVNARDAILRESNILVSTPDILHAWLLPSISQRYVRHFLENLSLVVVDEVHSYSGVFGSNSAFLFRRLEYCTAKLGAKYIYICASATISKPKDHLRKLFGRDFQIISEDMDTSPRFELEVNLANPPGSSDLLTELTNLFNAFAREEGVRFIAFVDSRKQTEYITSIMSRAKDKEKDEEKDFSIDTGLLKKLDVLPFRSGYEMDDRRAIQKRLATGSLKGVVSTSALELGMDIPYLNLGVLVGVPPSQTAFVQRIGRIGRHAPGRVIIINTGSVYDEAVFRNPGELFKRPPAEGALYLENRRMQYIHAMCLARPGGEHDQVCGLSDGEPDPMEADAIGASFLDWPEGFIDLCKKERTGEIPAELQSMKAEAGDDPNHVYPLRDVESQFRVELKQGPELRDLGTVSYSQLMREAYPGAVYYYTTIPHRVYKVLPRSKTVYVRSEKRYTTRPVTYPTMVFPNLSPESIYSSYKAGECTLVECGLQIRETITGYKERRGPNETTFNYPLDSVSPATSGIYFDKDKFTRNFFTSGVVITHPALNWLNVKCDIIAGLFFDAFLMILPYERRDINIAVDRHRADKAMIKQNARFIALYDQTYGSLRLTGRILEGDIIAKTADKMVELSGFQDEDRINDETIKAIRSLAHSFHQRFETIRFSDDEEGKVPAPGENMVKVILPGSKGLAIKIGNMEYLVEAVYYHPSIGGLAYRGRYLNSTDDGNMKVILSIDDVVGIPGETSYGYYNIDTGELEEVG